MRSARSLPPIASPVSPWQFVHWQGSFICALYMPTGERFCAAVQVSFVQVKAIRISGLMLLKHLER